MKNLHIENSYKIWDPKKMKYIIYTSCYKMYKEYTADACLNRSYKGMYVEWWLHNIGYYITRPFVKIEKIRIWHDRCKHVDLEEHFNY